MWIKALTFLFTFVNFRWYNGPRQKYFTSENIPIYGNYIIVIDTHREWCEVIRRVRSMPEEKVKSLLAQEVDPRNALLSIDIETIDSVAALEQDKKWVCVV